MKHYYAYQLQNLGTYGLLPLTEEAVFIHGLFYAKEKMLMLFTRELKERFQIIPKIDQFGEAEKDRRDGKDKQERVRLESNYEYQLSAPKDLEWFSNTFIVNSEEFLEFVNKQDNTETNTDNTQTLHTVLEPESVAAEVATAQA